MLNIYGISNLLATFTSLGIAIFVYAKGYQHRITRIWAVFALCVATYSFGAYMASGAKSYDSAFFWWQVSYIGVIMLPALFVHFVYAFLNIKRSLFLKVIYVITFVILVTDVFTKNLFVGNVSLLFQNSKWFTPTWWIYPPGPVHIFYTLFFYVGLLTYAHIELIKAYKKASSIKRQQIKYFFLATALGFIGGGTSYLPCFGINLYPVFNIMVPIYPIIMTYAILRHQLMDIEVIIKKTLVFAGIFATAYAIIVSFTFIGQVIFEQLTGGNRWISLIPSIAVIVLILRPLESFLINITDKHLFQKKYDYKQVLKSFTDEVITVFDQDKISEGTIDLLNKTLHPERIAIFLFEKSIKEFVLHKSLGYDSNIMLTNTSKITEYLSAKKEILSIETNNKYINQELRDEMDSFDAKLAIPLITANELVGIILLGKKKSDEYYTVEDLSTLMTLARTEAIAIKNSQIIQELAEQRKIAALGKFASGLSHNINSHLNRARIRLQEAVLTEQILNKLKLEKLSFTERKKLTDKLSEHIKAVTSYIDAGADVVKKARDFAKPAKGPLKSVDIRKPLEEAIFMVKELKFKKDIHEIPIKLEIAKDVPRVRAKENDLREVSITVLDNAVDSIRMKEYNGKAEKGDNIKLKVSYLKSTRQNL